MTDITGPVTFSGAKRYEDPIRGPVTFHDIKSLVISHKQGPVTFKDMTREEQIESAGVIESQSTPERVLDKTLRTSNVIANSLMGDVPFLRKMLPESIQGADPKLPSEKIIAPLVKVGRDIALYSGAGKALKPLTNIGGIGKTSRFISAAVQELIKGGTVGAATAESEDPVDIAKKAGLYGGIAAATLPAVHAVSWAGSKVAGAMGRSRTLKDISEWLGLSMRQGKGNELVRQRYGEINSKLIDSEKYLDDLAKEITPAENKSLAYLVESGGLDKIADKRVKKIALGIRKHLDDAHADLMNTYGKDVGFIKDYIPHMWDIPKNKTKEVVNWFTTRNPHLNKRRIKTIEEGIKKFGLKPKYDNVTDIIRAYDQIRIKSAANLKFMEDLVKLEDGGVKLVQRVDKAPSDWKILDHPAARRAMMTGKTKDGGIILTKVPVRVHPDIYPDVKAVLSTYEPGKAVKVLDTINTSVKQAVLNLSLFHHTALSETGIATGMGKEVLSAWNPVKVIKAFKRGEHKAFLKDAPLAKDAVKDGLNIGAISDVEGGRSIVNALKQAEKFLGKNPAKFGVAAIRKPLELNNKFLWDYLHTTYKLTAYSKLKADMIKKFPGKDAAVVGKEVAQFVNDTFGGQSWEIMAKTPQWQQFSRFMLLSPDWVLSTMRQAVSPFGVGAASKAGVEIRKEMGKDFWQKAILYFGGSMNQLNYAYTKAYKGKGNYMWDNSPGKETYLFTGYNNDGTERYLRWGKQFRELAEAINDPAKVASRKISPLIRMTKHQLFPDEMWQKEIADNPFWSKAGGMARATQLAKDVTPYSLNQQQRMDEFNPISFAMPVSRGMTPYRARKYFAESIKRKDKTLFQRVYKASLENQIDPDPLFKQAVSAIKSEVTFEATLQAQKIVSKFNKLGPDKGGVYLNELEMNPLVKKQVLKILEKRGTAIRKKAVFDKRIKGN